MIFHSPSPEICGSFDLEKAQIQAELLQTRTDKVIWSVPPEEDSNTEDKTLPILSAIGFAHFANVRKTLQTMVAIQNVNVPSQVNGNTWHAEGTDFTLGYSMMPTKIVVGDIDASPLYKCFPESHIPDLSSDSLFLIYPLLAEKCVELALRNGTAEVLPPYEPGTVIYLSANTIHKSFIPDDLPDDAVIPRITIANFFSNPLGN